MNRGCDGGKTYVGDQVTFSLRSIFLQSHSKDTQITLKCLLDDSAIGTAPILYQVSWVGSSLFKIKAEGC